MGSYKVLKVLYNDLFGSFLARNDARGPTRRVSIHISVYLLPRKYTVFSPHQLRILFLQDTRLVIYTLFYGSIKWVYIVKWSFLTILQTSVDTDV